MIKAAKRIVKWQSDNTSNEDKHPWDSLEIKKLTTSFFADINLKPKPNLRPDKLLTAKQNQRRYILTHN